MRSARLLALVFFAVLAGCRACVTEGGAAASIPVVVSVRPAPEGGWLLTWEGSRPRELTVPPDAATLDAVGDTLARTHVPAVTPVVLSVSEGIPMGAVTPVASALRRRGFLRAEVERAAK
ncbi:MAG: hypothetical protein RL199_129 [Pseudomonadota bacterium]|jgi:hypothetical protein